MSAKLFIGSSSESLDIALEMQAHLEEHFEVTVWNQDVFGLSRSILDSLLDVLDKSDFGAFVFAPDDISIIRDQTHRTVRDNVIFELGLFIGRLGKERSYCVVPSGTESLELPSDLAGITYAAFNPSREDQNLRRALATACLDIRKAAKHFVDSDVGDTTVLAKAHIDDSDALSLLETWMGARQPVQNLGVIRFADTDAELSLPPGTAKELLEVAARRYQYVVRRKGEETIIFESEQNA